MGDVVKVFAVNVAAVAGVIVGFGLGVTIVTKINRRSSEAKKRSLDDERA